MRAFRILGAVLLGVFGCGDSSGSGGEGGESGDGGGAAGGAPASFEASYAVSAPHPEGGVYVETDHAFFVGSLGDGSVHRIDAETGADEVFFTETAEGAWWTLGMAADEANGRLWVCAMEDLRETGADPAYDGYLWSFDLATGQREQVIALADASPEATCTDVAVASDGTVFVTDRDFGNVYRVSADGAVALFTTDPLLEGELAGQNAVVVLPDDAALLIAVYQPARLVRVDLASKTAQEVAVDGDFADPSFVGGADGMTLWNDALYVSFTTQLAKLTPSAPDWSAASMTKLAETDGTTDVVATPHGVYLLNGQAVEFALDLPTDPFALTEVEE